jgi:hypothetical protein
MDNNNNNRENITTMGGSRHPLILVCSFCRTILSADGNVFRINKGNFWLYAIINATINKEVSRAKNSFDRKRRLCIDGSPTGTAPIHKCSTMYIVRDARNSLAISFLATLTMKQIVCLNTSCLVTEYTMSGLAQYIN